MAAPVSQARHHPHMLTDAERALWQKLRDKQLCGLRFRRQAPIGDYITDFACFNPRLIIELDGGQHAQAENLKHDAARTEWLEGQGFQVIRFWNNDVLQNIEGVVLKISRVLEELSSD